MDYDSLVGAKGTEGSIKSFVNYGDIPSAIILTEAQAWIYNRLRHWKMRVSATWAAAIDDEGIALPADLAAPIDLYVDGWGDPLPYLHEAIFPFRKDTDGALYPGDPQHWTIMDDAILFDVRLSQALAGDFWYYEIPTALSSGNPTNFLTDRFPTLLRRVCRAYAFEHMQRTNDYLAELKLAQMSLDEANEDADNVRLGQMWE